MCMWYTIQFGQLIPWKPGAVKAKAMPHKTPHRSHRVKESGGEDETNTYDEIARPRHAERVPILRQQHQTTKGKKIIEWNKSARQTSQSQIYVNGSQLEIRVFSILRMVSSNRIVGCRRRFTNH